MAYIPQRSWRNWFKNRVGDARDARDEERWAAQAQPCGFHPRAPEEETEKGAKP